MGCRSLETDAELLICRSTCSPESTACVGYSEPMPCIAILFPLTMGAEYRSHPASVMFWVPQYF